MNLTGTNFRTLTLVALAAGLHHSTVEAQFPDAPPIASPAPRAGAVTEEFNGVKLAAVPEPGAAVDGWYPLQFSNLVGSEPDVAEIPLFEEVPPALFDAPAGVLRFLGGIEQPISGRVRQIPSSNTVSVDLYLDSNYYSPFSLFGLVGNPDKTSPAYSLYVGTDFDFIMVGDNSEVEELPAVTWFVGGDGFRVNIEGDLLDQWLRLEIRVDEVTNMVTYLLNGVVIHEGGVSRRNKAAKGLEPDLTPLVPITEVGLVNVMSGFTSEPEPDVEEAEFLPFAFFDNLSHEGGSGTPDLTVGGSRSSSSHKGGNVYGSSARQEFTIEQRFNLRASAWFSLQNDGGSAEEISVRGRLGGAKLVRVKTYAYEGGRRMNVTGAIAAGAFQSEIAPGKEISILSEAKLAGRGKSLLARKRGAALSRSQTLEASSSNGGGSDEVKAIFNFNSAIPLNRPGY